MTIALPNRSWFYQPQGSWMITNTYTGSVGTDPETGVLDHETFNYRVFVEGKADDPSFKAQCYLQKCTKAEVLNSSLTEKSFDISEGGFDELIRWINDEYERMKPSH